MKRSTASWTTAVAASALLALPVGSWAQQPTPSTTPPQQTTGAPAPQTGRTPGADTQQGSANEHLRQAQSALADISAASLTGTAKTKIAELKRHLSALEKAAQKPASATAQGSTPARGANWSADAAAADRILSELLDPASTTGASTPAPTGTTGSTATAPKTTTSGKPAASVTLDEAARTKLQEVRTHITAFAAAMSGASASSPASTPAASADPSAAASASAASATASPATAGATATPAPTSAPATPAEPTAAPATPAEPAAAPTATPAQSPTQPPDATPATPSPTPSQQVDAETVKRHLTAARDTLSQLTQLPAAAQLTGDARTQVSQLISNFNELITTNVDWRGPYSKLQGNLSALVGEQRADESPTPNPTPATGTAGAVGTSGTVTLDPAIRAKLVEFRSHLAEFEKAAGGSGTPAAKDPAAQPAEPSAEASTTAAPSASTTAAPSASTAAAPSSSAASTATASPTASPEPAATTGSTSQTPATAGTSGTGTPMPASEQATKPSTSGRDAAQAGDGHRAAMTHIEAIEAILNGGSPTAGTTGSTAKPAAAGTLDRAQIEQIRTHLAQLRKELDKSSR